MSHLFHIFHIFRKDLRRYWPYILALSCLTAVQAALYGRLHLDFAGFTTGSDRARHILESALGFGWPFLAAVVIYEDSLPGSTQDWLFRPIGWRKLLAAKCLFVLIAVVLPNIIADACSVALLGLDPFEYLPGLLARHALRVAGLLLPVLAVATLTTGIPQGVVAIVAIVAVQGILSTLVESSSDLMGGFEWLRFMSFYAVVAVFCLAIVIRQYATRLTTQHRPALALGCILVFFVPTRFPASVAGLAQRALAPQASTPVRVEFDSIRTGPMAGAIPSPIFRGTNVVYLPIRFDGMPAGLQARVHRVTVELQTPEGQRWASTPTRPVYQGQDGTGSWLAVHLPKEFFERHGSERIRGSARLAVALYSASTPATVIAGSPPVRISGIGLCGATPGARHAARTIFAWCAQPFQQPRHLVMTVTPAGAPVPGVVRSTGSTNLFNPLPADFDFDPISVARVIFAPADSEYTFDAGVLPAGSKLDGAKVTITQLTPVSLADVTLVIPDIVLRDHSI